MRFPVGPVFVNALYKVGDQVDSIARVCYGIRYQLAMVGC